MVALTASSSVASATEGCTDYPVAYFAFDRQVRGCIPLCSRIIPRLNPITPASPDVLGGQTSDRGLPIVDAVVSGHSGHSGHPDSLCLFSYGSLSTSLQLRQRIPRRPQFFCDPLVVAKRPKAACFAPEDLMHQAYQHFPPRAGASHG